MAQFDATNPLAVVVGFFAVMITFLMFVVKGALAGGVVGVLVSTALFFKVTFGGD